MARALILAPFSSQYLTHLRRSLDVAYESWLDTRQIYDPEQLAMRLRDESIAALVVESDFVFEDTFEGAPRLKFVGVCRNATYQIDVEAATRHEVVVVNTPARNAQAVAEHALGLMFALARRIPFAHNYVTGGRWKNPAAPYIEMRGAELAGRTLGIIGLGAIGRSLVTMASGIGMRCIAYDPYAAKDPSIAMMELDPMLSDTDFVSIHAPLTPETHGLLDARRLGLMKPTSYMVNLSDAQIVSESALVSALRNRSIAGAAMDVFEAQPLPPNSPLRSLDNIVLTPHLGGATEETVERHSEMMSTDLLRFLRGERPINLVNPDAWNQR